MKNSHGSTDSRKKFLALLFSALLSACVLITAFFLDREDRADYDNKTFGRIQQGIYHVKKWFYPVRYNLFFDGPNSIMEDTCQNQESLIIGLESHDNSTSNLQVLEDLAETYGRVENPPNIMLRTDLSPKEIFSTQQALQDEDAVSFGEQVSDEEIGIETEDSIDISLLDRINLVPLIGFFNLSEADIPPHSMEMYFQQWNELKHFAISDHDINVEKSGIMVFNNFSAPQSDIIKISAMVGADGWYHIPQEAKYPAYKIPLIVGFHNDDLDSGTYFFPTAMLSFVLCHIGAELDDVKIHRRQIIIETADKSYEIPVDNTGSAIIDYDKIAVYPSYSQEMIDNAICGSDFSDIVVDYPEISVDKQEYPGAAIAAFTLLDNVMQDEVIKPISYFWHVFAGGILVFCLFLLYFGWKKGFKIYSLIAAILQIIIILILQICTLYFFNLFYLLLILAVQLILTLLHKAIYEVFFNWQSKKKK